MQVAIFTSRGAGSGSTLCVHVFSSGLHGRLSIFRFLPWPPPVSSLGRSTAHAGLHRQLNRNFQMLPPLEFLAALTQHIPPKGLHLIRYYVWSSNKSQAAVSDEPSSEEPPTSGNRQAWAVLIKRVYAVAPLCCPECGGQMQVVSLLDPPQADVIEAILKHCGLWQSRSASFISCSGRPRFAHHPQKPPCSECAKTATAAFAHSLHWNQGFFLGRLPEIKIPISVLSTSVSKQGASDRCRFQSPDLIALGENCTSVHFLDGNAVVAACLPWS